MIKNKNTRFPSVRTSEDQVERLVKAADLLEETTSDLVRRAVEKELARLARRFPELERQESVGVS